MLVRRAERVDAECVVRGYLAGRVGRSTGARARSAATSCPSGLREADRLPEIPLELVDTHVNDPAFADLVAERYLALVSAPAAG